MSNRSVYESTVSASNVTLVASNQTNALACQESANAVGVNIGANPSLGVTAAHDLTIRQAYAAYAAKYNAAQQQATVQVARDLLASQGDTGPR